MKTIPLTKGYVALVDDQDYDRVVAAGPWHVIWNRRTNRSPYAAHTLREAGSRAPRAIYLHKFILRTTRGVDHISRDGLDNRRANLRLASLSQNGGNRAKQLAASSSRFKGVSWCRATRSWKVMIQGRYLGVFALEEEAARVYDAAARQAFGEFARLNFQQQEY